MARKEAIQVLRARYGDHATLFVQLAAGRDLKPVEAGLFAD